MLKFGYNVTAFNILYYLTGSLDLILIGKFCGAAPTGLYSRAKNLTTIPVSQLLEPTRYVSLPALSASYNDPVTYRNYFAKMLAVLSFLYMPLVVYIGIYSTPIVFLSLGSQWMDAAPLFRLLAISMFASPIVTLLGLIMLSSGLTERYFFWGLFTSLSTVIALLVGIQWGVIGVAASWPVATTLSLAFSFAFVFKGTPVSLMSVVKSIYRPAIASVIMGISLLLTYEIMLSFNTIPQLSLSFLAGVAVYLFVWVLFPGGYKTVLEFVSYPLSAFRRSGTRPLAQA